MNHKIAFRLVIILQLICFILSIIFSLTLDDSLPAELQEYLEWEFSQPISVLDWCCIVLSLIMIAIQFVSSIFLFFFRKNALWFYFFSVLIFHLISLTIGPIVDHAYTYTAEIISALLSGVIIGGAFFNDDLFNNMSKIDAKIALILKRIFQFIGVGVLVIIVFFVFMFIHKRAIPSDIELYLKNNLVKDQDYHYYECAIPNWFAQIWVTIDYKPGETYDSVVHRGLLKTNWTLSEVNKIKNYAAQELLSLKNESWLDDNESPFTIEQFVSRLTLDSITIDDDDSFEINFFDGNLFFGHSVYVRVNSNLEFYDAGIQG